MVSEVSMINLSKIREGGSPLWNFKNSIGCFCLVGTADVQEAK